MAPTNFGVVGFQPIMMPLTQNPTAINQPQDMNHLVYSGGTSLENQLAAIPEARRRDLKAERKFNTKLDSVKEKAPEPQEVITADNSNEGS